MKQDFTTSLRLLIPTVLLATLTACGGGSTGTTTSAGTGTGTGAGTGTPPPPVYFFNTYPPSSSYSSGVSDYWKFQLDRSANRVAVNFYGSLQNQSLAFAAAPSLAVFQLDDDGVTTSTDVNLNITNADDLPGSVFGAKLNRFARTAGSKYLTPSAFVGAADAIHAQLREVSNSGTLIQNHNLSRITSGTVAQGFRVYPMALLALSTGKFVGAWVLHDPTSPLDDGNNARTELLHVEWMNADGTSDGFFQRSVRHSYASIFTLVEAADGGLIVAADYTTTRLVSLPLGGTAPDIDAHVLKISSSKQLSWERKLPNIDYIDIVTSIHEATGGNIVLSYVGEKSFGAPFGPSRIVKLSPFGGILANVQLPVPKHSIYDMRSDVDGTLFVTGTLFSSFYNAQSLFIAKLDANFAFTQVNVTP